MKAAENEVASHMEEVIERAKSTDGWDIEDVVSNVNGHVSKVLDSHGIEGATKEKSMEHLDKKLTSMLEEISVAKEFEPVEEMEPAEEINPVDDFEAFQAAETEVAAHMDAVIKRAKAVDGWDIDDVLRKVDVGVSKILDDHAIGDDAKENAMDHLNDKLSKVLEEISAEKESKLVEDAEAITMLEEMSAVEELDFAEDAEAMKAAENEVASHMEEVIERAKSTDGWDIEDVVSNVNGHVSKVLDSYGIEGATKEKSMEHLDKKLTSMLEEISVAKEFEPADEMEPAEEINPVDDFEAFQAAENEVAAHMEEVIERAKNTDGWDIEDVLSKV